jgi:ParB family chromosome partitioning protein
MSNTTKRGLGRGLGALIPTAAAPAMVTDASAGENAVTSVANSTPQPQVESVHGLTYAELDINVISPNPRQPRLIFDEEALAELVASIREIGLLQPIVVRPVGNGYELVAGERRLRSCKIAGLTVIPAIIRETDDDALLRDALLENLHRANLNPLEEAAAYQQLLEDFGCTQEELATRIGRSRPQISNTLRLLKLPSDVQKRVAAGVISAGHARALLGLEDPAAMQKLADRIVKEGLSVRSVEEIILVTKGDAKSKKKSRTSITATSDLLELVAGRLEDRLDTRVVIAGLKSKTSRGKITIEVADLDDLRRIADAIDPNS